MNRFSHLLLLIIITILFGCKSNPNLQTEEGYIDVRGGKIWYRILGEGNEAPILILHGGPGGTSKSFYLFASLSEERPVILFDQLGSGRSYHHKDTSLLKVEKFVEQVEEVKTALGLNEFYLYGHSWGTALALEYYLKYPKGIKGILFNSPYFSTQIWEADADTLISTLPDSIQQAIRIGKMKNDFSSLSFKRATYVFNKNFGTRKTSLSSELDSVPIPRNRFVYNYMWGPTEFTSNGTLKNYSCVEYLKNITIPTLFITGEFDEARPETVRRFQNLVPNSEFALIEDAGHGTMHDNLSQNISAIRNFLNELELE